VTGTKGELNLTRVRLEDATSLADRYLEQLAIAENRVERLKSETVQRVESKTRATGAEKEEKEEKKEEPPEQSGNRVKTEMLDTPLPVCLPHH
jgi:E3 ubiquitin-protein ligase BRE1